MINLIRDLLSFVSAAVCCGFAQHILGGTKMELFISMFTMACWIELRASRKDKL